MACFLGRISNFHKESFMDRRSVIKNTGLAGILAAGVAPAVHAQAALRWRLTSSFPKALDTLFGVNDVFAAKVKEMTGGKFEITTHAAGELVPAFGTIDATKDGTVEMSNTAPYYYFGKDETFALGCAIPFGLNSRQMTAWMFHGNGMKLFREFYSNYGIVNFPMGNTGAQMGGWFRKPIKGLADLKGLKMRIAGLGGEVLSRLGGIPQQIAGGDIYPALERGVIDAAEWVGPYDDEKLGFYKIAPNYYYPGWWEACSMYSMYVNTKEWEKLPKAYQSALEVACYEANSDMMAEYDYKNPEALGRLLKNGVKLFGYSQDIMKAAQEAAFDLYAEEAAKNPAFKKIYEPWKKFRTEQFSWSRVAEQSLAIFMLNNPVK
jgi:TRAP-type mannitol/chloroaromatic compound transport system substrate-binding protein